jgi:hypothetical protein
MFFLVGWQGYFLESLAGGQAISHGSTLTFFAGTCGYSFGLIYFIHHFPVGFVVYSFQQVVGYRSNYC